MLFCGLEVVRTVVQKVLKEQVMDLVYSERDAYPDRFAFVNDDRNGQDSKQTVRQIGGRVCTRAHDNKKTILNS